MGVETNKTTQFYKIKPVLFKVSVKMVAIVAVYALFLGINLRQRFCSLWIEWNFKRQKCEQYAVNNMQSNAIVNKILAVCTLTLPAWDPEQPVANCCFRTMCVLGVNHSQNTIFLERPNICVPNSDRNHLCITWASNGMLLAFSQVWVHCNAHLGQKSLPKPDFQTFPRGVLCHCL